MVCSLFWLGSSQIATLYDARGGMPLLGAEEAIGRILHASPSSKVLILTMYDEPHLVRNLLASGAHGYMVKKARREELVATVRTANLAEDRVVLSVSRSTVSRLEKPEEDMLSAREVEVLRLTARAMTNRQIACQLHISEATVKRHLTNAFAKLGVTSRIEATKKAFSCGLITFRDLFKAEQ